MYLIIIIFITILGQLINTIGCIVNNDICIYIGLGIIFFIFIIHTKITIHHLIIRHQERKLPWYIKDRNDKENNNE